MGLRSVTRRAPGLLLTEHTLDVPLDHDDPTGERIDVFARAVVAVDKADADLPWLVFLQGGPGFEAPRPLRTHTPVWFERALTDYRVLMLDQRGTGRSTPIGPADAERRGPEQLANHLALHRADSIVRDAELIRAALHIERWSVLGQSFGGFCVVTYLSLFPESLREAFVCGGLPPLDRSIDEVYAATYRRTIDKTRRHYERYPDDADRVRALVDELAAGDVQLPNGDRLTARRLRQLGNMLGMGDGSEELHYILELPSDGLAFAEDVVAALPFGRNPLYAVVHESCYAPGQATKWAAQRTQPDAYDDDPTLLTGEHVFPWMFEEYGALRPFAEAAQVLADRDWGPLYDPARLAVNDVPCAAAVYADDMYVEREFSEETASRIRGLRMWLTNEYEHDGIRAGGTKVLDRLIAMVRGIV